MLGALLRTWKSENGHVTRIAGLDALLSGEYPFPLYGPTPIIETPGDGAVPFPVPSPEGRQVYIPEPWDNCPVIVWSRNDSIETAISSLKKAIPSSLATVGYDMPGL